MSIFILQHSLNSSLHFFKNKALHMTRVFTVHKPYGYTFLCQADPTWIGLLLYVSDFKFGLITP